MTLTQNLRRLAPALVAAVLGCGPSGPPRFDVEGEVTFRDRPLPAGTIFFDPDPARGGDGPQGFAYIKDGKFDTRVDGRQVVAGPQLVRIQGFDGQRRSEQPLGLPLFPEYVVPADLDPTETKLEYKVPEKGKS